MSKRTVISRPSADRSLQNRRTSTNASDRVVEVWKSMFVVAEHWKSDLGFFLDELNFFRKLIDRYLLILIDEKRIAGTRHLAAGLKQFEKERLILEGQVKQHMNQLTNLIQNPFAQESQLSLNLHSKLESALPDFVKNFKAVKKEVFALSESAMEVEKAKHLLGR